MQWVDTNSGKKFLLFNDDGRYMGLIINEYPYDLWTAHAVFGSHVTPYIIGEYKTLAQAQTAIVKCLVAESNA